MTQSLICVDGEHARCSRGKKGECTGVDDNEYVYEILPIDERLNKLSRRVDELSKTITSVKQNLDKFSTVENRESKYPNLRPRF